MVERKHIVHSAALLVMFLACLAAGPESAAAKPASNAWVLESGREIPSPQPSKPTLRMQGQQLSGSTGCNSFTATLRDRPDKRVAIENVSQTRKLCGPKEGEVEAAFVRALSETEVLKKERGRLTFLSGKQEILLVWTRAHKSTHARSARRKSAHAFRKSIRTVRLSGWCLCCR
jgi:heat shock protein HslJ